MLLAIAFSLYAFYKVDTERKLNRIEPSTEHPLTVIFPLSNQTTATSQQIQINSTIVSFATTTLKINAEFENMWEISNKNDTLSFDNKIKYYLQYISFTTHVIQTCFFFVIGQC